MQNLITIHGYLGRDPEIKEMQGQNGSYKTVSFSVGVGRDYGNETDWFRCSLSGKRAEVIDKYFSKGSQIIVTGRMESYKPKNDPEHTNWILKVTNFDFCGSSGASGSAPKQSEPEPHFEEVDEDIPF